MHHSPAASGCGGQLIEQAGLSINAGIEVVWPGGQVPFLCSLREMLHQADAIAEMVLQGPGVQRRRSGPEDSLALQR